MTHFQLTLDGIKSYCTNSPLIKLSSNDSNLYAKIEYSNIFGSIKDRPAFFIINEAINSGKIDTETTVIESSSGNFAIALANICNRLGIKFIPVIDKNISCEKEKILNLLTSETIKITERDETGGYLLNRIAYVKKYCKDNSNIFNPNQYENKNNYLSYYHSLGQEINNAFNSLDFAFISVSSGGTITGLSLKLKEKFKNIKIVAVDIEGSFIFNSVPKTRYISSLGSSLRTSIVDNALIDDVIILSHEEIINGCHDLLKEQSVFAGGSSGAVYCAAKKFLRNNKAKNTNSILIFPDRGDAYIDTIFNKKWAEMVIKPERIEI